MNRQERDLTFEILHKKELEILSSKGYDYADMSDCLSNFKELAQSLGMTKYQVWAVYFSKHISSILGSIKKNPQNPQVESEPLGSRINDARNYLGLLSCMLNEDLLHNITMGGYTEVDEPKDKMSYKELRDAIDMLAIDKGGNRGSENK